jgi:aminoglycoside 6'-N-acetyltransferase I
VRLVPPQDPADPSWLSLRVLLWPEASKAEHLHDMAVALSRGHCVFLAFDESGLASGFVEASKRNDYVNGTATSPVAFLEGLYVQPSHRRRGVARALVSAVASWATALGLSEFASDSLLDNVESHTVHRALGFVETERVVYFRRSLPHVGA